MTRFNPFAHARIMGEVSRERMRQIEMWGVQDHPSVMSGLLGPGLVAPEHRAGFYGIVPEGKAKEICERRFAKGYGAYADIAIEEMSEAICADDDEHRRVELIQVAAVCVAWIEAIDRRAAARALDSVSMDPPPASPTFAAEFTFPATRASVLDGLRKHAEAEAQSIADAGEFTNTGETVFPAEVMA